MRSPAMAGRVRARHARRMPRPSLERNGSLEHDLTPRSAELDIVGVYGQWMSHACLKLVFICVLHKSFCVLEPTHGSCPNHGGGNMTLRIESACWLVWLSACAIAPAEDSAPVTVDGLGQELAPPEGVCSEVGFGTDCGTDGRLYLCVGNQPAGEGEACPNGCRDSGGDSDACIEAEPCSGAPEVCDGTDNDCDGSVDEGLRNACGGACGTFPADAIGATCEMWGENDCVTFGTIACNGPEDLTCEPNCWYLCVRGESAPVRTQDPCAWGASGGDVACVPENPNCF
jgi:Putative metal-binding motif